MSNAIMSGQLYMVKTRAVHLQTDEKIKCVYLLTATSPEDVERRLRYLIDMSRYDSFSISSIEKIQPRLHCVSSTVERLSEDDPPMVEKSRDGTRNHYTRSNQPRDYNCWAVGIAGRLHAATQEHALRRLGKHLSLLGSSGVSVSPLQDGSVIRFEALGMGTLEAMPVFDDIFPEARVYRGGAIGMGK